MKRCCIVLILLVSFSILNPASSCAQTAQEYVHLGNVSGRAEKYPQAIIDYTKAIEDEPNFADAYYNRGYIYIKMKKYKLAIADLDKAVEINPNYASAYHVRGIAYFYKKKYLKAIADYNRAIDLEPDNIRYRYSRMSAYCKLNDYDHVWKDVIKIQELGGTVNPTITNLLKDKKYRDQE